MSKNVLFFLILQAVNYEDVKNLDLGIVVRNKAEAYGSAGGGGLAWWLSGKYKTYPVQIKVQNQPEGAEFDPKVKAIPISEGGTSININDVIAHYPAIDGDTGKPAENVRSVFLTTWEPLWMKQPCLPIMLDKCSLL